MPDLVPYPPVTTEGLIVHVVRAIAKFQGVQNASDLVSTINDASRGMVTHWRSQAREFARAEFARADINKRFDAIKGFFEVSRSWEAANCHNFCQSVSLLPDSAERLRFMAFIVYSFDDNMWETVQMIDTMQRQLLVVGRDRIMERLMRGF